MRLRSLPESCPGEGSLLVTQHGGHSGQRLRPRPGVCTSCVGHSGCFWMSDPGRPDISDIDVASHDATLRVLSPGDERNPQSQPCLIRKTGSGLQFFGSNFQFTTLDAMKCNEWNHTESHRRTFIDMGMGQYL